ncbi:MAG: thermonuclease family protein [candidate division WOR-3 bacterium]|nr:thermonuclease family protein [candidate division WOR-3 bacterium]
MKHITPIILFVLIFCSNKEKVTEVIDGDTFKTEQGKTVRLLGINAPELDEPGGDIAKEFLKTLILDKKVQLKKDVTEKDDYGRYLCYVYLDGKFINEEMLRTGLAETKFYPPDTLYKKVMQEVEKIAIRNKKGLWSFPVFQIPDTTGIFIKEKPSKTIAQEVISYLDANKYIGKVKTVEGTVVLTNNTGKVCFLNFHKDWKRHFTAVIFASDFDKFPKNPEDYYLNRKIRVTGLIKEYKGKPEIIVKSPSQIEIIK